VKNKLKFYRERKGKSQRELSWDLRIPQNTYSGYERGEREPKLLMWKRLADYFDITIEDLIDEK